MWTGGVRTEAVGNRVGLALHLRAVIVAGASDCEDTRFHRKFLHRPGRGDDPVRRPSSLFDTVPLAARRHLTEMAERLPHQRVRPRARCLS